jgi:hypothetical protein
MYPGGLRGEGFSEIMQGDQTNEVTRIKQKESEEEVGGGIKKCLAATNRLEDTPEPTTLSCTLSCARRSRPCDVISREAVTSQGGTFCHVDRSPPVTDEHTDVLSRLPSRLLSALKMEALRHWETSMNVY